LTEAALRLFDAAPWTQLFEQKFFGKVGTIS
jgi:hypothetical protein